MEKDNEFAQELYADLRLEFGELRKEILNNATVSMQMLAAILFISGTAAGFALKSDHPDYFASAVLGAFVWAVSGIGLAFARDRARSTGLIAAYLRRCVEKRAKGLGWETSLFALRDIKDKGSGAWGNWSQIQLLSYNLLSIAALALTAYFLLQDAYTQKIDILHWDMAAHWDVSAALISGLVFIILAAYFTARWVYKSVYWTRHEEPHLKDYYDALWSKVEKAEAVSEEQNPPS